MNNQIYLQGGVKFLTGGKVREPSQQAEHEPV